MILWLALSCKSPGLTEYPAPPDDTGGADSGDTSDTGDTAAGGSAPVISEFTAEVRNGVVRMIFQVSDADDDLSGGTATFVVPGVGPIAFAYPDDFVFSNGAPFTELALSALPTDEDVELILKVADRAGNTSAPKAASYRHDTTYERISESGNDRGAPTGLGMITPPYELEGDLYAAENNGSDHTGDTDWIKFAVPADMGLRLTLTWEETGADYDIYLYEEGASEYGWWSALGTQPEVFDVAATAGTNYFVEVTGWSGSGGDYTLRIAPAALE